MGLGWNPIGPYKAHVFSASEHIDCTLDYGMPKSSLK